GRVKDAVLGRDGKRRALREIRREIKDTLQAASCCRKARFSRASWRWPPHRNGRSRSRWSRRMIIGLRSSPDQSRQINHLLTGRSFGEGQVTPGHFHVAVATPGFVLDTPLLCAYSPATFSKETVRLSGEGNAPGSDPSG